VPPDAREPPRGRPPLLPVARAFFHRGLQEALSYRAAFGLRLFAAGFTLAAFYFLARFINMGHSPLLARYGGDYLSFGLVGMVLLTLQHTAVSAYPQSIRAAQVAGTLEAMLATPAPAWLVLVCSPLYRFASAFVWAAIYLLAAGLLFGVRFENASLPALAVAVPLTIVAFASLGFFGAALTMLLRRTDPISPVLSGISSLLGGVLYPTSVLPGWLQTLGRLLPITHALEMIRRAVFAGATLAELGPSLAGLALLCAVTVPAGLVFFGWTLGRTRRDGSLTHF
jgi:ABC-2 type transport system permease protein